MNVESLAQIVRVRAHEIRAALLRPSSAFQKNRVHRRSGMVAGIGIAAILIGNVLVSLPATAAAETEAKRIALIVGNAAYKTSPLKNAVNDARALARALSKFGFEVQLEENVSQQNFMTALRTFGNRLRETQGIGLFYYAGHGMQIKGSNYLIPVDTTIEAEDEVRYFAIDAGQILDKMDQAGNRLNIVILDACRDNPFARNFRSKQSGLAQMDAPSGMLIAFSTSPGSVASDGDGANGIYTKHLLRNLSTPGLPIELVLKRVRESVSADTGQKQIPWESSSLLGDFYFVEPASGTSTASAAASDNPTVELVFWNSIKDSNAVDEFAAYLKTYPEGRFTELAQARMTLAAKNSSKTHESRSASPTQIALATPGAAVPAQSNFPVKIGDQWSYALSVDGVRSADLVMVKVVSVEDQKLRESVSLGELRLPGDGRVFKSGVGMQNGFLEVPISGQAVLTEFAPYYGPGDTLSASSEWPEVENEIILSKVGADKARVNMSVRVIGPERVKVPAGEFVVTRVEARSKPAGVVLIYWYSADVRRVVKITRRTLAMGGALPSEQVFELAGFQQSR